MSHESRNTALEGRAAVKCSEGSVLCSPRLPGWGVTRQVPGEEACAGHALHLCFLPFRLQSSRGRKASGRSTKASSCTTPLMSRRARAWTRTRRARSAPGSGRASCPRTTTGPPTSTTSRGSGTGSLSQLWQVRRQRPHSEVAAHCVALTCAEGPCLLR